jgi:hypothetical protein
MRAAAKAKRLELGDRIGPYRLEEWLGQGGIGAASRVVHEVDSTTVAPKILREELAADESYRRRFHREARLATEVQHPHLVDVVDAGEDRGRQWLATRYVPGRSLRDRLEAMGVGAPGAPPFAGRSVLQVGPAHLRDTPPDPASSRADLTAAFSWVVRRALARRTDDRPPNAIACGNLLRAAVRGARG